MLTRWILLLCLLGSLSAFAQQVAKMCPNCGHLERRQEAKYCILCGHRLVEVEMKRVLMCPNCETPIDKGGRFCAQCGAKGVWKYMPVPKEGFEPEPFEPTTAVPPAEILPQEPTRSEAGSVPVYPGATLLENHNVDEGLYHTSKQRAIVRKVFACSARLEEVERFYRSHYRDPSIIKAYAYNCFQLLNFKVQLPQQEIQIAFYSVTPLPDAEMWREKCARLRAKFAKKLAPAKKLEQKITDLQQRFHRGEVTYSQIEERLQYLQEEYKIATNSSSYWNTRMMDQVLESGQNLLLITSIVKK